MKIELNHFGAKFLRELLIRDTQSGNGFYLNQIKTLEMANDDDGLRELRDGHLEVFVKVVGDPKSWYLEK
jgi:hypothetical protein